MLVNLVDIVSIFELSVRHLLKDFPDLRDILQQLWIISKLERYSATGDVVDRDKEITVISHLTG